MQLLLHRFSSGPRDTIGVLYAVDDSNRHTALCYTLEDESRERKVPGETRIPAGCYPIELRTVGRHHERYGQRFPSMHRGMLWLRNVPNFRWILIHTGADEDDTDGCILVGSTTSELTGPQRSLHRSAAAYEHMYRAVVDAAEAGGLAIVVEDFA